MTSKAQDLETLGFWRLTERTIKDFVSRTNHPARQVSLRSGEKRPLNLAGFRGKCQRFVISGSFGSWPLVS